MRIPVLLVIGIMSIAPSACSDEAPQAPVVAAQTAARHDGAPAADAPAAAAVADEADEATADDRAAVNAKIDDLLGDHTRYERAFAAFQSAVAGNDRAAVAALVAYPFTARINGKAVKVADAGAFVARYDDILTPAIAAIITGQAYGDLFVNAQGVMFGNGEAWINGICRDTACGDVDVRVVAIQPTQP